MVTLSQKTARLGQRTVNQKHTVRKGRDRRKNINSSQAELKLSG